jgi:hypothetical protein
MQQKNDYFGNIVCCMLEIYWQLGEFGKNFFLIAEIGRKFWVRFSSR